MNTDLYKVRLDVATIDASAFAEAIEPFLASVTWTVNVVTLNVAVAVPLTSPVEVLNVMPAGRVAAAVLPAFRSA